MNTHTISSSVSLSGRGLHTGKNVTVTFNPAPEHTGIMFRRVDLPGQPMVHAIATNVFDTSRGTSLKENNAEVRTVEHLMAALAGLQIDNVIVDIDAEETPILDGSARYYVEALQKAGIVEQQQEREYFVVTKPYSFSLPEKQIEIRVEPYDGFDIKVDVDYGTAVLATQTAELKDIHLNISLKIEPSWNKLTNSLKVVLELFYLLRSLVLLKTKVHYQVLLNQSLCLSLVTRLDQKLKIQCFGLKKTMLI